jgi:hypothetical protein
MKRYIFTGNVDQRSKNAHPDSPQAPEPYF